VRADSFAMAAVRMANATPDADPEVIANLRIDVRPLASRSQWAWHLTDSRDEAPQCGFHSAIDAERSVLARLAELRQSSPGRGSPHRLNLEREIISLSSPE
jgi:hypothetical protein